MFSDLSTYFLQLGGRSRKRAVAWARLGMWPDKPAMVPGGGMSSCEGLVEIDGSGTRLRGRRARRFRCARHLGRVGRQSSLSESVHSVGTNGEGERKVIVGSSRPGSWRKIYLLETSKSRVQSVPRRKVIWSSWSGRAGGLSAVGVEAVMLVPAGGEGKQWLDGACLEGMWIPTGSPCVQIVHTFKEWDRHLKWPQRARAG